MIYIWLELIAILVYSVIAIIKNNFFVLPITILGIQIVILSLRNNKQKLEIKNLSFACDETRTFRHDFNNIMLAIGGYIKTNNIKGLKKYYGTIMPEVFHTASLCHFNSKLKESPAIYGIISNKYEIAEKLNIKFSLDISINLNEIHLDCYHLSRILGILLDNAIEASKNCSNKVVNLSFLGVNNKQIIIIENTYTNKNISIKKLFSKNFSTKEKHSGLGLWKVNKIISKYKNVRLYTKADNDFFTQELEIS